jgi:hypothetical protein
LDPGAACAGFDVRRYCALIDPSFPAYDDGYKAVIVRESNRAIATNDKPHAHESLRLASERSSQDTNSLLVPTSCCGGMPLPEPTDDSAS